MHQTETVAFSLQGSQRIEQAGFRMRRQKSISLFAPRITLALSNCSFLPDMESPSESLVWPLVSGNKMFSSYRKVINSQVQVNNKSPAFNPTYNSREAHLRLQMPHERKGNSCSLSVSSFWCGGLSRTGPRGRKTSQWWEIFSLMM